MGGSIPERGMVHDWIKEHGEDSHQLWWRNPNTKMAMRRAVEPSN